MYNTQNICLKNNLHCIHTPPSFSKPSISIVFLDCILHSTLSATKIPLITFFVSHSPDILLICLLVVHQLEEFHPLHELMTRLLHSDSLAVN